MMVFCFCKTLDLAWTKLKREIKFSTFLLVSVLIALLIFWIIQFAGDAIGYKLDNPLKDFWLPAFAALFGSITAFGFSFYNQSKTEFQNNLIKLIELQFILFSQSQYLFSVYTHYLKGLNEEKNFLQPLLASDLTPTPDFKALLFILQSPQADLLNQLLAGQKSFDTFLKVIYHRNSLCLHLQDRTSNTALPQGNNIFDVKLSPVQVSLLNNATDNLRTALFRAWRENQRSLKELNTLLKEQYKDCRVLSFSPLDENRGMYEELNKFCSNIK